MPTAKYYARFMHLANVAKFSCECLGASFSTMRAFANDYGLDKPSPEDLESVENQVGERFLALLFLKNLDQSNYGHLFDHANNNGLISGNPAFPMTVAGMLESNNNNNNNTTVSECHIGDWHPLRQQDAIFRHYFSTPQVWHGCTPSQSPGSYPSYKATGSA